MVGTVVSRRGPAAPKGLAPPSPPANCGHTGMQTENDQKFLIFQKKPTIQIFMQYIPINKHWQVIKKNVLNPIWAKQNKSSG